VTALFPALPRHRREARRRAALEDGLPEAVDLLALAVGAGLTVRHALAAVVPHIPCPLAAVMAALLAEVERGRSLADALDDLPSRAGDALRPLASVLAACERYGAPLGDALDRLAVETRDRQRRRSEQRARRVPVLLLFPLVLCILPAFALLAVAPLFADAVAALRL
jgi:tight adherence protein C